MADATQKDGIVLNPSEVTIGHKGIACEFLYAGSNPAPVIREGKIEGIKGNAIVVAMKEGGFKSFSIDKMDTIFLFI